MPPRTTWRNLFPGIAAFAAVVLIAIAVLVFAGVGKMRGEKVRVYIMANQARGVLRGTEVWIAGQKVGVVDAIEFRPPSADTTARVVLVVSVRKRDVSQIRRDSRAQIRPGLNFIGPVVVYLAAGTPSSPALRDGDTLRAGAQSDFELAGAKLNTAMEDVRPLLADARVVMARVKDPNCTVGAILAGGFGREFRALRTGFTGFKAHMMDGGESLTRLPSVMARTQVALARADSILTLVNSPNSSYGRFRRDASFSATVASVRDEIAQLRATLDDSNATLGRLKSDSALTKSIALAQNELSELLRDIRRRPLRYVHF
jgi:phospholipid/cholesterol/gamma-HCH transport system substrate-binding protein